MIDENVTQFLQNCKYKQEVQDGYRTLADLIKGNRPRQPCVRRRRRWVLRSPASAAAWQRWKRSWALPCCTAPKGGVQPTAECRQLLPSVRELLFAQERLEQTAAKVRGADCGTIVIGTAYNCYYEWVTRMMAAFRTRHPGVVIKIVNGTSSEPAEMLLDHRTDFCLISHRDLAAGLAAHPPGRADGPAAQKPPAGGPRVLPGGKPEDRAVHRQLPWAWRPTSP